MEDETNQENLQEGMTFSEIWRMMLRRIWYILGAAVLATVIAVLVVCFAVNPGERSYSMEFNLSFPTGAEFSYPDGEPFYFTDMVEKTSLDEVKKGSRLNDIDTDRMIRRGDIGITAETVTQNGETRYTGRYTVSAKSSYFSGADQAETFFRAIAQVTVDRMHAEAGNVDYTVSEETFRSAPFEERLNLLAQERETLLNKYDEWIKTYDAAYKLKVGETEKPLKEFRAAVTALFGESAQNALENELKSGGYYYTADLDAYKAALKAEYARNKTEIEELRNTGASAQNIAYTSSPVLAQPLAAASSTQQKEDGSVIVEQPALNVSQRLAELIGRNANILHWLGSEYLGESGDTVTATLTAEKNAAFAARLDEERAKLASAAEELTAVTKAIYERGMQARFDVQKVNAEGGVSAVLVGVATFIVAFLIACCVVYAVDRNRGKDAAGPSDEAQAQPEEPEEK